MRLVYFLVLVLASTLAKEEEDNEVNLFRKPAATLDANFRRALLKALTELENEENEKKANTDADKTVERASASALSFFASTTEQEEPEEVTPKPIVVIQRSQAVQHKPNLETHEQILTSATSSFTSNKFHKTDKNPNLVSTDTKTKLSKPPKIETTTVTTTTEESQAKVEDVQFFSAPLVAAFTVHQDERGLPKSVEPIYRTVQKTEKVKEPVTTQQSFTQELRTQLALQEKQKALEAEILRLKQHQQQQNYLIRQQQILHQQQLQLQKQKILDEQNRFNTPFLPTVTSFQPTTQRSDFSRGSLVSFQPSISFTSNQHPTGVLPLNAQQLPVKNSVDFRSPFETSNNLQQFNYLRHQQPPLENSVSSFNFAPTVEPFTTPRHHRVFRQESNTGNFFNSNFRFDSPQNNRFFRSNVETVKSVPFNSFSQVQPPVVNQQLNHLLYNSGLIRGKQQEDLNIVSKVLALNHYGGDYRFAGSSVSEQRVPAPVIKKV